MSINFPEVLPFAGSRFPVLGRDYNPETHRYDDTFLNPRGYSLRVVAFPGVDTTTLPPDLDSTSKEPVIIDRLRVPPDTVAFDFSIVGISNGFSQSSSHPTEIEMVRSRSHPPAHPWEWNLTVPSEGTYDITLQLRNKTGGGPKGTGRITMQDYLVVSIGDSTASGQGNPDIPGSPKGFDPSIPWWHVFNPPALLFELTKAALEWGWNRLKQEFTTAARKWNWKIDMDPEPVWLEAKAYRSLRSGPALAAKRLEDASLGRSVTFLSFGRSGSSIREGLIGPRGGKSDHFIGDIGQIEETKNTIGDRQIDVLVISIGLNDLDATGRLADLVVNDFGNLDEQGREVVRTKFAQALKELPTAFAELRDALEPLKIRDIYLTEYPTSLFDQMNGEVKGGCGIFTSDFDLDLTRQDALLIKETAEALNDTLRRQARRFGWFYIDGVADGFRGHGYCTGENTFFVGAEESMVTQGDTEGTIHPNAAGHDVYAKCIAAAVKKHTFSRHEWLEPVLHVMMR